MWQRIMLVTAILGACGLTALAEPPGGGPEAASVEAARQRLADRQAAELAALHKENDTLKQRLAASDRSVKELTDQRDELQQKLRQAQDELARSNEQVAALRQRIDPRGALLARQNRYPLNGQAADQSIPAGRGFKVKNVSFRESSTGVVVEAQVCNCEHGAFAAAGFTLDVYNAAGQLLGQGDFSVHDIGSGQAKQVRAFLNDLKLDDAESFSVHSEGVTYFPS